MICFSLMGKQMMKQRVEYLFKETLSSTILVRCTGSILHMCEKHVDSCM